MIKQIRTLIGALALTAASTANAGPVSIDISRIVQKIAPMQAYTINLGDFTAVVFYTQLPNENLQVITTIGPNLGISGAITQHQIEYSPGQRYTLNVDQKNVQDLALYFDGE